MIEAAHTYSVVTFKAKDNPLFSEQYLRGHIKVLTDFGIQNITSNNNSWMLNPDVYCIALFTNENRMMGGIRIQLANGTYPLPIEAAIGCMDHRIYEIIDNFGMNGGVGELSGLWVDNSLKGLGIGWYLVRAAIASSNQLNFKTLIGICGDVTLTMFKSVGFNVDEAIGENGTFLYPNEHLIAYAVGLLDVVSLEGAVEYDKNIMLSLRESVQIDRIEKDKAILVKLCYNLKYFSVSKINYKKKNEF